MSAIFANTRTVLGVCAGKTKRSKNGIKQKKCLQCRFTGREERGSVRKQVKWHVYIVNRSISFILSIQSVNQMLRTCVNIYNHPMSLFQHFVPRCIIVFPSVTKQRKAGGDEHRNNSALSVRVNNAFDDILRYHIHLLKMTFCFLYTNLTMSPDPNVWTILLS